MENNVSISIIIVNYNSGNLLSQCIQSIFTNLCFDLISFEIIVIDNNSNDTSIDFLSNSQFNYLRVIKLNNNVGFAKANNIAAGISNGNYLHFLNPDTIVTNEINTLYNFVINIGEDVYVNTLIDEQQNRLQTKHLLPFLSNYFRSLFLMNNVQYWYLGASVILKKDIFEKIGKWPEDYFMYSEDIDIFFNINKCGVSIVELPQSIIHIGRGCTSNVWNEYNRSINVETSLKKFYMKYNKEKEYYLIRLLTLVYLLFFKTRLFHFYLKVYFDILFNSK
jgi:GT2 family glycosyltransferase